MGSEPSTPDRDLTDEQQARLLAALDSLSESLREGLHPDLDEMIQLHPDLADDLRELWGTVNFVEVVTADDETSTHWGASELQATRREAEGASSHLIGTRLGGHQLLEEIGRGGMGIVYRARDLDNDRIVALKCLARGHSASPTELARFRAEATAAAKLNHPHIIPLHYVEENDGEPYFVMTYIEGATLSKRLADRPMTAREAASLLLPVCRAIHYAHDQGVLHRDLKPSNILINTSNQPFVGDFGLAKLLDMDGSLTQTGAILGTPSYMAPEQASRSWGTVGPRSDVYSLGAILYQMISGRPPFMAPNPLDVVLLLLEQDPIPPRVLVPKVNSDLEMIALKCLQKSPGLRYSSAGALADDLEAFLAGESISARSTTLRALAARLLGETHHAVVLENWGMLWICHGFVLVLFFGLTNVLLLKGIHARWPYVAIFTLGLGAWAALFWELRRRGGPISFVERQLAHVWGAGVIGINLLFLVEWLIGLPVLTLAPMIAVMNGTLFLIKGGILSGSYYLQAVATLLTVVPMALYPRYGPILFGVVAGLCFFLTGLKYHLRARRAKHLAEIPLPPELSEKASLGPRDPSAPQ